MTISAIPLIGVMTLVSCANPPPQPANFGCSGTDSPDHQLRACIVEFGKFPPPLNESRVDIRDTSGKLVASRNFGSPKGDQGRSVVHSAWTPDSSFFVFSNRAGHGVRSKRHPNRSRRHQASRLAVAPENGCRAGSLLDLSGRMPELPSARRCRGITNSRKFFSSAPVQS